MMSNNHRLASVIKVHLSMEEARGEYSSDRRKLEKMAEVIKQVVSQSIFSSGE
jgi:hypothetical protein